MDNDNLLNLTADIITAHVENNKLSGSDLPMAISSVYAALASLAAPAAADAPEAPVPAVSIRSSLKATVITCLECGKRFKSLKKHLMSSHGLTADQYRQKWNLPAAYPMVTSDYSARRSDMAKQNGLGRRAAGTMLAKAKSVKK